MCDTDPTEFDIPFVFQDGSHFLDTNNGKPLPPEKVAEARKEEINGFSKRQVYEIRPRSEARAIGQRPVGVRWVDVEKKGSVRSRLVCQDFNPDKGRKNDESVYAPTPPLLASRWLVSKAASEGDFGRGNKRLMCVDFTKAFLYGAMTRQVFIELPNEDARKTPETVGLLHKAMYGLRDAPAIWQSVVQELLLEHNFKPLVTAKCVYYNSKTKVTIVAHVDDFLLYGDKPELSRLLASMQKQYECSGEYVGGGAGESREVKYLGRTNMMV